jgi:DNA-binding MarR family transcriptional regulator
LNYYNDMMQQMTQRVTVPSSIASPRGKLVFLYLATHGGVSVDQLQDSLDMTKLSLFSILQSLEKKGLVEQERGRYAVSDHAETAPL